jgi:hypothetical protein
MLDERKKRPRFSFRLQTLMVVVAIVAIWLGWNVQQVRERASLEGFIVAHGGTVSLGPPSRPWKRLPLVWVLLGAKSVSTIDMDNGEFTEEDQEHIEPYFPEAEFTGPARGGGMGMM